ncbi:MAG: CoA-binding protein [Candidatus Kapaibacteriales bacterium]
MDLGIMEDKVKKMEIVQKVVRKEMFDKTVEILKKYDKIAVVGMSANQSKPSHNVPEYMDSSGYTIYPVNPKADEIGGKKVYRNLLDIEEEVEVVNVFRPSNEAIQVVRDIIQRNKNKGDVKAVWLQLGIFSNEAKELAEQNGLEFVDNKCIMVEHRKV